MLIVLGTTDAAVNFCVVLTDYFVQFRRVVRAREVCRVGTVTLSVRLKLVRRKKTLGALIK